MQLISKEKLLNLGKTSNFGESASSGFNYNKFKEVWINTKKELIQTGINNLEDVLSATHENVLDWLSENQNFIGYVGVGSSRISYALKGGETGGKCLKIALNKAGVDQNAQEVKTYTNTKYHKLKCFSQIYDYQQTTFDSILTECCSPIEFEEFKDIYGITLTSLVNQFTIFNPDGWGTDKKYKNIIALSKDMAIHKQDLRKISEFWKNCASNKDIQWEVIRDLLTFYFKDNNNINELIIGDLRNEENWGFAWRSETNKSTLVPIILDYGFSKDVQIEHYPHTKDWQ